MFFAFSYPLRVQKEIRCLMAGLPDPILRISRYVRGGKMVRSLLMQEMGNALGAGTRHLVLPAAILELVHTTTILHDDVIDLTDLRRGETTVHTRFQGQAAVFAADLLFSICMGRLADLRRPALERDFHEKIQLVCRGEIYQDLHAVFETPLSPGDCVRIAREKTGGLFALAFAAPGHITGQPENHIQWLTQAGFVYGTVFQLMDDIHDVLTDSRKLKNNAMAFRHWTLASVVWNAEDPSSFRDFVTGKADGMPAGMEMHIRESLKKESRRLRDEIVKSAPASWGKIAGIFHQQVERLITV